jgi:hypothetical protein
LLIKPERAIEISNVELGFIFEFFDQESSVNLIVEDSGLIVSFEKVINLSRLTILSSNQENKTLTIHSKIKKSYPKKKD